MAALVKRTGSEPLSQQKLHLAGFEELHIALEELKVAEEELYQQNSELCYSNEALATARE